MSRPTADEAAPNLDLFVENLEELLQVARLRNTASQAGGTGTLPLPHRMPQNNA